MSPEQPESAEESSRDSAPSEKPVESPRGSEEIFVSYAREEQEFVRRLLQSLESQGIRSWVDWRGIEPATEWMDEIRLAIERTGSFLFVISPDSVESKVCLKELGQAVELGRRLIPIVRRPCPDEDVPEALRALAWTYFHSDGAFESSLSKLVRSLKTDRQRARLHGELSRQARSWDTAERDRSRLLQGTELEEAEQWFSEPGDKLPRPTPLVAQYIVESKAAQTGRLRKTLGIVSLALAVIIGLALLAWWSYLQAEQRRRESLSRSLALQADALQSDASELALLLAVESFQTSETDEARGALLRSISQRPRLKRIYRNDSAVQNVALLSAFVAASDISSGLIFWDRKTGNLQERTPQAHPEGIRAIAADASGQRLATADWEGNLLLWGMPPAQSAAISQEAGLVQALAWAPQADLLVTGALDGRVEVWDVESATKKASFSEHGDSQITDMGFSADGSFLATLSINGLVAIRDPVTGAAWKTAQEPHTQRVLALAFSPDGPRFVTGGFDGKIVRWEWTGKELSIEEVSTAPDRILDLDYCGDDQTVVTGLYDGSALLWDLGKGTPIDEPLQGHDGRVTSVVCDRAAREIMTSGDDGRLLVWDASRPQQRDVRDMIHPRSWIPSLSAAGKQAKVAVASGFSQLQLRNLEDGTSESQNLSQYLDSVWLVAFGLDGKLLAVSDGEKKVILWDSSAKKLEAELPDLPDEQEVFQLAFLADGRLAIAKSGAVLLWRYESEEMAQISLEGEAVLALAASPSAPLLAAGLESGEIVFINTGTERLLDPLHREGLPSVYDLDFSPDGSVVAAVYHEGQLAFWTDGGELIGAPLRGVSGRPFAVAFDHEGKTVAVGDEHGTLTVWSAARQQRIGPPVKLHDDFILDLAFIGPTLVSSSADGSVGVWNMDVAAWQQQACQVANRQEMTEAEWMRYLPGEQFRPTCDRPPPTVRPSFLPIPRQLPSADRDPLQDEEGLKMIG